MVLILRALLFVLASFEQVVFITVPVLMKAPTQYLDVQQASNSKLGFLVGRLGGERVGWVDPPLPPGVPPRALWVLPEAGFWPFFF